MRPENRALLTIAVAFVVVVSLGSVYFLTVRPGLTSSLPIPAGTVIEHAGYKVSLTVVGGLGRLDGAWYANHGGLIWIYLSDSPPVGPYFLPCIQYAPWNGTANLSLVPGTYTMEFNPGTIDGSFVITQTIHLGYPGDPPGVNRTLLASWCGSR